MELREIHGLFDADVTVLTSEVGDAAVTRLSAAEAAALPRAVDKRRREYATGRWLAREALRRLGIVGFDLLNAADRAPIWPEGIAGSISHSNTRAVVAVTRRDVVGTVGVDVEHRDGLDRALWRMTLLPDEIAFLEAREEAERRALALVLFSAKEALYKAQYPRSETYMGFMALAVEIVSTDDERDPARAGHLRCVFQEDVGPFARGTTVRGRYRAIDEETPDVVCAVRIAPG